MTGTTEMDSIHNKTTLLSTPGLTDSYACAKTGIQVTEYLTQGAVCLCRIGYKSLSTA